ncbi:hypothetical protein SAMN04488122_5212 [Chitinophaga arvensicola]|uniref:Uncharacterized protein n=1 Tax=Chitinophaga arvensicola TaxID=29529 RepID=A0A1I0S9I4_9BACT|nr:hypothetical protein SAMN04488122_5212 [Chitinophaga arvensicola]
MKKTERHQTDRSRNCCYHLTSFYPLIANTKKNTL